jgi:hypothetical protein
MWLQSDIQTSLKPLKSNMQSFRTQQKLGELGNIIDYAFTLIKVGKISKYIHPLYSELLKVGIPVIRNTIENFQKSPY